MAKQNKHLDHLEDRIILEGLKGGEDAIKLLKEMGKFLTGKPGKGLMVTTKWDGAPAIVCGTDPSDGKFFVGTKSVFAKDSKLCKSQNDIQELYSGGLAAKLSSALRYLPNVVAKNTILQGDLMFTDDKKMETINGQRLVTFRPNTITYAAEPSSPLGKSISAAKLGIVFHTKYSGDSIANLTSSFNVKNSDFKPNSQVWAEKAEFKDISGAADLSAREKAQYDACIKMAEGSLRQTRGILNKIQSGKKTLQVDTEFLKFFNNYVKEGRNIPSVKSAFQDFYKHLYKEYDKVAKKYKKAESVDKKVAQYLETVTFIEENEREISMLIATYMNLQKAKTILVSKMKKVTSLKLFVDKGGGDYECTTPEGFVAVSNDKATKLIDRLEFSRLNFTIPSVFDKSK